MEVELSTYDPCLVSASKPSGVVFGINTLSVPLRVVTSMEVELSIYNPCLVSASQGYIIYL